MADAPLATLESIQKRVLWLAAVGPRVHRRWRGSRLCDEVLMGEERERVVVVQEDGLEIVLSVMGTLIYLVVIVPLAFLWDLTFGRRR